MAKDKTRDDYRECFNTASGRRVLGHLLIQGGFFDNNTAPEEIAVENFVKDILRELGMYDLSNVEGLVDKLFELPVKFKDEEK